MTVIGAFKLSKEGGWTGTLRTLTINARVRFVPNDDRVAERAPDFHVLLGWARIGEAWTARTKREPPRDYLRVRLDDPALPAPIAAALFPDASGMAAELVWTRRRERRKPSGGPDED